MTDGGINDCCVSINGMDLGGSSEHRTAILEIHSFSKTRINVGSSGDCRRFQNNEVNRDKDTITIDLSSKSLNSFPEYVMNYSHLLTFLLLDYNNIAELPQNIKDLQLLQILSLNGNDISFLPIEVGTLLCLQELYLCENNLKQLPETIGSLKCLKTLSLRGNSLKYLPKSLNKLTALEELTVEENRLCCFPHGFGDLCNLKCLQANDNQISCLPSTFGKLRSLENLNLSCNKLRGFPQYFGDLRNVTYLDLSKNMIEELPPYFKSCIRLRKLYLDYNGIIVLPRWVSSMPEILEFSIADNKLTKKELTETFGHISSKLKKLDLGGNFINELPESFGQMKNLEIVHFGSVLHFLERRNFQNGNWIIHIPSSFGRLHSLKELYFDENQIGSLPTEFGNLVSLELLDLGQNLLYELPESFGNLKLLRVCLLSKNKLQLLPSCFGKLLKLEDVRLDNNQIAELPESFSNLTQLNTLDLFNNKLRKVPDCLKGFTQLVRLDIDKNPIDCQLAELPSIIRNTRYAPRDPALKDNWRGKLRQDVLTLSTPIIVTGDDGDQSSTSKDIHDTETLKLAVEHNESIWRKHGDEQVSRPKFEQPVHHRNGFAIPVYASGNLLSDTKEDENEEALIPDDVYVKEVLGTISSSPPSLCEEEENWDDEMDDETGKFESGCVSEYLIPYPVYQDLPENRPFLCLPYTLHEQSVSRIYWSHYTEIGQFDDIA